MLSLSNIVTTPATAKIRIAGATDADGYTTAVIEIPITRQAATKPTLTSISNTSFTYGVQTYSDLVFNETLQSFLAKYRRHWCDSDHHVVGGAEHRSRVCHGGFGHNPAHL